MIRKRLIESHTFLVTGGLSGFAQAAEQLSDLLDRCAVRGRARTRAEVVFEEVVTNIIRHAYGSNHARVMEVQVACAADAVQFVFTDDGPAFDPLVHPDTEPPMTVDGARDGGLGIHLVRKMAARIYYHRGDGRNRLLIVVLAA